MCRKRRSALTTRRKSCIFILTGRRVFTGTITSYESGSTSNYNPFRYAGYYYDGNTGLYYLINRYYNPAKGRFMSEDPFWNVDNMLYGKFADDVERQVYYPAVRQSWNRSSSDYTGCTNSRICFLRRRSIWRFVIFG